MVLGSCPRVDTSAHQREAWASVKHEDEARTVECMNEQSLPADSFLDQGGDVGALMRSVDWNKTPLGPIGRWP